MEAEAAKLLGAGLAAVGAGLASLGVGNVFAKYLEGALRNPGAADGQQAHGVEGSLLRGMFMGSRCASWCRHSGQHQTFRHP